MKLSDNYIFKKLTFQIVFIVSIISILLAIGFYTFLLRPFTESIVQQIELSMNEHGLDIYSVCDQTDMEIMRLGLPENNPAIKVKKGYALGLIENFMMRKDVFVLITKDDDIVLKPDRLTTESVFDILTKKEVQSRSSLSLITYEEKEYYAHTSSFDPWNWHITIMKDAGAYTAVTEGIKTFYISTGFLLICGALILLYYFNRVIMLPLHRIISRVQQGEKPDYRGIEEFEYLSINLKKSLEQIDLNTRELETINVSLKKEIEERMNFENSLKASEKKYRSLVETTLIGVYKTNLEGEILYANEALSIMLEYDSPEVLMQAHAPTRYNHPEDRQCYIESLREKGRVDFFETELLTRTGNVVSVLACGKMEGDELSGLIVDITERKQVEKELSKFKFISDNANDSHFLVDRSGKFQYVNNAACRALGYTEEELLKLTVPDVDNVYDLDKFQELFDLIQIEEGPSVETIYKRKDGSMFPSEITVTGYQIEGNAYMFGALRDISKRKSDEEKIKFLADIIDTSPISVVATDREGNIRYVNPATENLFGYAKDELLGKSPVLFNAEPNPEEIQNEIMDVVGRNNVWKGEMLNKRKNGEFFPMSAIVCQLLDEEGEFTALVGFQEDITERKDNEKALRNAKEEIEAWSKELEGRVLAKTEQLKKSQEQLIQSEKLSAMGEMAGGLAHELNSPLAGLLPMIEKFMDESDKDSDAFKELSLMLKACSHMAKIVRDFRSFSRETKGEFAELNVHDVIDDTLSFSTSRFKMKSIQVVKEYNDSIPNIMGEKTELQQVVLNIITNALDAMPDSGTLAIKTGISENRNNVIMEFSDNGIGINKESLGKIFDPFYTTKRPGKGTGLGLSISYKIMEKHGGNIVVESEQGIGTRFTLILPLPSLIE